MRASVRRLAGLGVLGCVVAIALAGCGSISDRALHASLSALEVQGAGSTREHLEQSRDVACGDPTASLRPQGTLPAPGHMPAGTFMRTIQDRGRLIVGVDQNTLLLGYLNPFNGQIEGFDIDMLRQVAKAIFGDPNAIEFKAISSAQRIPVIQDQSVDIVADAMTINCERSKQVAFTHRLLRRRPAHHGALQLACAQHPGSSREGRCARRKGRPRSKTSASSLPARSRTPSRCAPTAWWRCRKARWMRSPPTTRSCTAFRHRTPTRRSSAPGFSDEPYGMAINKGHPDLVRFVNAVLAQMRGDGTWASIYEKWLGRVTHAPAPAPPQPHYHD